MLSRIAHTFKKIEKEVIGINGRNVNLIYPNNDRKNYKFADDKLLTKKILEPKGISCPTTYAAISKIGEIESTWESVQERKSLVIKPAKGSGGDGIIVLKKNGESWFHGKEKLSEEDIFSHIATIIFGMYSFGDTDRAIIEELLIPHCFLTDFYEDGVADIRIITWKNKPVMGMLRLPTKESDGKANLHQGGLGVGIDLDTGTLTHVYDGNKYINAHPDSKREIQGKKLPGWKKVMELAIETSKALPLDYLGIDIVINKENEPQVLEINVRPGLGIQMANRKGLKDVLSEYLERVI